MQLRWRRATDGTWCAFETAVLPDAPASGIVVVWAGGGEDTVYVGQGGIAKNLRWARQFEPIARHGGLFVTWATVPEESQNGVRNYLVARLRPMISDRPTPDRPIPVNLPWDAA